ALDQHLDQIEQRKGGFCGRGDEDEVEGSVVAVGNLGGGVEGVEVVWIAGGGGRGSKEWRKRQKVAGCWGTVRDEGENFGNEALLSGCFLVM
ncbi:MAG: hypothetical protein Q9167_007361, partial [Letrouitia subvulpina]